MDYTFGAFFDLHTEFQKKLNFEKIKEDFFEHLAMKDHDTKDILAYDVNSGKQYVINIKKDDNITFLAVRLTFSHNDLIYAPILVSIGIGQFEISSSLYKVDKCSADMLYNDGFELMAVDFIYDEMHHLKEPLE